MADDNVVFCDKSKNNTHSLFATKHKVSPTAQHATQYVCENCFRLFDHKEIGGYHTAHHGKRS